MDKIYLNGSWQFRGEFLDMTAERWFEVANRSPEKCTIFHAGKGRFLPSKTGFIDATLPGDIITPLVENGLLDEPLNDTNSDDCMWLNNFSWWYLREFEVDEKMMQNEEVRIFIGTLDYNAAIIINGKIVTKQKNAFRAYHADVKKYLKVGINQIIIRVTVGYETEHPHDSLTYYSIHNFPQRIYLRKAQFTHGWDWCKPVPTCGVGGEMSLTGVSGANIGFLRCDTLEANNDNAKLELNIEIENLSMCTADDSVLHIEISHNGEIIHKFDEELYLAGGINFIKKEFTIKNPKLWMPNGYGEQPLYEIKASVDCRGYSTKMKNIKFGIRTIKVDLSKYPDGSRKFDFIVNGVKVFCKGGNWVPADSVYLRITDEKYKILVDEAKACNFTMLRIWGGGIYEPDVFYDYCSENGIMVMQDFMYACAPYPEVEWFKDEALKEAEYQTKRLANQACIAAWTGNNEIHELYTDWFKDEIALEYYYGTKIFNYILPEVVRRNCPHTHYMPSSPFYGNKANDMLAGDSHIWNWIGRDSKQETSMKYIYEIEAFDRIADKVRMSSEYGFWGPLPKSSLEKFHIKSEVEFGSKTWMHHGEHKSKTDIIIEGLDNLLIDTENMNFEQYLLYSGLMQGILYDEITTALRRKAHTSGQLIWMYNDCWPETGWTVIDYYTTRKPSFYFLKRAFDTNKLIIRAIDGVVTPVAINESSVDKTITVEYGYMDFNGNKKDVCIKTITVNAFGRYDFEPFEDKNDTTKGFYYMIEQNFEFAHATSIRGKYKKFALPIADIEVVSSKIVGGNRVLVLRANKFVAITNIVLEDDTVHLSDNYFQLLPNIEKEVIICGENASIKIQQVLFSKK